MYRPFDPLFGAGPRKLFLIDIENLVGSGKLEQVQVAEIRKEMYSVATPKPKDVVLLAANPINRRAVYEGWPGAMYNFRHGKNGADLEVLSFFRNISKIDQFTEIILGTGDEDLVSIADEVAQAGLNLTVVSRPSSRAKCYEKYQVKSIKESPNV